MSLIIQHAPSDALSLILAVIAQSANYSTQDFMAWVMRCSLIIFSRSLCYTSTKSWRGYIFTSVCLSVCVCVSVCEQNADRTATPILTRSSLNGCLLQSLEPYWNWWPWFKGQGHSDVISIFLQNSLLTSLLWISALLCLIKMKFSLSLRYVLGRFVFEFDKIRMCDDIIVQKIVHITNAILVDA